MGLQFNTKINLTEYGYTEPTNVPLLCVGNEPNNDIWQYMMEQNKALARQSHIENANYEQLLWGEASPLLTSQKIARLGIKHFPQIGAIGHWTLLHEDKSQILAPIHVKSEKLPKPNFYLWETENTLQFLMFPSEEEDINYICYRIILRLDYFAEEYISYDEFFEVPKPQTTGTYDIYCVGYIHEGEAVSDDSDHYELYIEGIRDTWPGPDASADLFITDVEVTGDNKIIFRRSDGFIKQSVSGLPSVSSASFLPDGRLALTLSSGAVIVTDNTVPEGAVEPVQSVSRMAREANDVTNISASIAATEGLLLMCVVVHRYDITSVTTGWTRLVSMPAEELGTDDYVQRLSIYYKYAERTPETFSITQASAERMYLNIHTFRNAGIPDLYIPQQWYETAADPTNPVILNKQTSEMLLWCVHTRLYASTSPYPLWELSPNILGLNQLSTSTQSRLLTIVDDGLPQNYMLYNKDGNNLVTLGIRIPVAVPYKKTYVTKEEMEEAIRIAINESWEATY